MNEKGVRFATIVLTISHDAVASVLQRRALAPGIRGGAALAENPRSASVTEHFLKFSAAEILPGAQIIDHADEATASAFQVIADRARDLWGEHAKHLVRVDLDVGIRAADQPFMKAVAGDIGGVQKT